MTNKFGILTSLALPVLTGCLNHKLPGDAENQLNQALVCDATHCPYLFDVTGSELKLMPGYILTVNSLSLQGPVIKDQPIFQLDQDFAARNVSLPTISSFDFQIPDSADRVDRKEALFVAFLLASALDSDGSLENLGRDYSEVVQSLRADSGAVQDLVRSFTTDMKLKFPNIESDISYRVFDRFQASFCAPSGKVGSSASIDVQALEFSSGIDPDRTFRLGQGLDWTYSWTVSDVLEEETNTSVVLSDGIRNSMFGFDVSFALQQSDNGPAIVVNACESLGELSRRIQKRPWMLKRDCRVSPPPTSYVGASRAPCSEGDGKLTIRFNSSAPISGPYVRIDPRIANRLMLLPGDELLFGN